MPEEGCQNNSWERFPEHCAPWFKLFNILTLPSVYIYETCVYIHARADSLQRTADVHRYDTRGKDLLLIPFSRTATSAKNRVDLRLYNHLPVGVKSLDLKPFKAVLKKCLTDQAFYCIDDFFKYDFS